MAKGSSAQAQSSQAQVCQKRGHRFRFKRFQCLCAVWVSSKFKAFRGSAAWSEGVLKGFASRGKSGSTE